jgi:small subunit ribosomal protein S4
MPRKIKEKKERALGVKLFLKAERCNSPKCALVRKPYPPGMHGQGSRRILSDYGRQLKEKQKLQVVYGLNNKQVSNLFKNFKLDEIPLILERRLDKVVYNLGFAKSLRIGRQLVLHGHILVNGKKVTIPSYLASKGDKISIRPESMNKKVFSDLKDLLKQKEVPLWLKLDVEKMVGEVIALPPKGERLPFDISLVAEFYSR